ncbi:hypothetical protein G5714_023613 [Onychostoma macrolepis]|uniref:DDE Tnp4 domain-containing protein n=1 Tax=Onychostoma macrolepis TaxID=369639 RepID=A0A7J6BLT9_9TELE|nr:hypothetical protein G5714_023613 [Onychostoma macrolepis]
MKLKAIMDAVMSVSAGQIGTALNGKMAELRLAMSRKNIYRPAFLSGRSQMSACEVRETQAIARLRVHVERLIRRVKEHKFFDTEIPLRLFGNINQLYTVACLLTNYENGPLVKAWAKKPE